MLWRFAPAVFITGLAAAPDEAPATPPASAAAIQAYAQGGRWRRRPSRETRPAQRSSRSTPGVPQEYQDLYPVLEDCLRAFNTELDSRWDGTKHPVKFSAELYTADNIVALVTPGYYEGAITPFLNQLQSMGIKAVKVQMGFPILYEPFYAKFLNKPELYGRYLAAYRRLIRDVRDHGMKFIAQCQEVHAGRGAALRVRDYYRSLSFEDYQAGRSAFLVHVAQQLKPDYLMVQTEPDTEARNSERPELLDASQNAGMIRRFLRDLKAANAHSMIVGSGLGAWLPEYRQLESSLAQMPDLDLIDIHVYPINTVKGVSLWRRIVEMADAAHAAGKRVGVSEAWLYKIRDNEFRQVSSDEVFARDHYSFWAPLDQQFLRAMVHFAHYKKLDFMNASLDRYFLAYVDYEEARKTCGGPCGIQQLEGISKDALARAIREGQLTETGKYYSTLIR